MQTIGEWWMWLGFFVFVAIMLFVDMFLLGGKRIHRVFTKEAAGWVLVWVTLALAFNLAMWWYLLQVTTPAIANTKALEFFTGYLIELSLSIDNMFIFLMLFEYFSIPAEYQRRVLLYGVLSAIVMRLIMILLGVWVVEKFHWILYVFGFFLVLTGIKMFIFINQKPAIENNPFLIFMRKYLRITNSLCKEKFMVVQNNQLFFTPLFIVLVLIEISDLIFAVDSIPAIFAITQDPFIIFTSNIFAILGLRSLYFLLSNIADRFHFIKYGLALILVFVGIKMLIEPWIKIPILMALGFVGCVLLICAFISIIKSESTSRSK